MSGLKSLFWRVKWPGWFAIILAVVTWLPDWESRFQFWLGTAKMLGGHLGQLAAVVASPFFSPALLISGLLYLYLIGEPKKPVRNPVWSMLGWVFFGGVAIGLLLILTAGYVAVNLPRSRHLTIQQESALKRTLGSAPDLSSRIWIVSYPECFECRAYAWEFATAMNEIPQWKQKVGVLPLPAGPQQLSTLWRGVIIGSGDPKHLNDDQAILAGALHAIDIKFSFESIKLMLDKNGAKIEALVLLIAPQED